MTDKYDNDIALTGQPVVVTTADGQRWRIAQPTPEQAANANSAYRLARQAVLDDARLASLAATDEHLQIEANTRAVAAEAVYLLPLLLQRQDGDGNWMQAYDITDPDSLDDFERLDTAIAAELTAAYLRRVRPLPEVAKKKSDRR